MPARKRKSILISYIANTIPKTTILKNEKSIFKDRLVIYVVLFIAEIAISVVYAVNTFSVWNMFFSMGIILLAVLLVMPVICDNKESLEWHYLAKRY